MKHVLMTLLLGGIMPLGEVACVAGNRNITQPQKPIPVARLSSDKDPVCRMKLASTVTDTLHYGGQRFGFCSKTCRQRFHQAPARYAKSGK